MNPERFTPKELIAILNEYLQPQNDEDDTEIYSTIGLFLFQRYNEMSITLTLDGNSDYGIPFPEAAVVGNRLVRIIDHPIYFTPEQLFLFSIFGVRFLLREKEALLPHENDQGFYYTDKVSDWREAYSRLIFYNEHTQVAIPDKKEPLSLEETFALLSPIFGPGEAKRRYYHEKERDELLEYYRSLQEHVPPDEDRNLSLQVISNTIDEGDVRDLRSINFHRQK